MWTLEQSRITEAITPIISGTIHWDKRFQIAWYVELCMIKGFCKTADDMRACANRYMVGKRKVTPPGTERRKKLAKEQQALRQKIPQELLDAVKQVVGANAKAISQYKQGNDKAINALIGQVMRKYKTDAVVIKELIIGSIND